jgi:hypothetical protein
VCHRPVQKIGRLCDRHDEVECRTGHPLGHTVRVKELRPYLKRTSSYIKQHQHHPTIAEAIRRIAVMVYGERKRNLPPRPNATAHERLSGWFDRMERSAVPPEELLGIVAAMFLYQQAEPHAFRSSRHFRHQLAVRFIRKAPSPFSPLWRRGAGSKRYDRITVATRELLASKLEAAIGLPCLRMARALHHANNPYSPEQEAAIRAPLPSIQQKEERQ